MTLPKWATTVTPLSKIIALFMFIAFPILGILFGMKYQQTIDISKQTYIPPVNKSTFVNGNIVNKIENKDLCDFQINLPTGYHFQNPINSFYGYEHTKANKVTICNVILGPNYASGYEGFSGKQIQINSYPTAYTDIGEIIKKGPKIDSSYLPLQAYRFTRPSYGGEDEVLVFENNFRILQIIWRNNPNNIEYIIKQIIKQI